MPFVFGKSGLGGDDRYGDEHGRLIDDRGAVPHPADHVSIRRPKA